MPFTSEQITAILGTLDAIYELTMDRVSLNTAPIPVLVDLENAARAVSQARQLYQDAAGQTPTIPLLQEAH